MTRQAYTSAVLSQVRRLTAREREAVRAELDGHIEDHLTALLDLGYDEELAEERTMHAMGDPEEVGREIDKQYPLRWLIFSRVALGLLVAACALVLLSRPSFYEMRMNLQVRLDPMSFGDTEAAVERGLMVTETDIRIPMGDDIWYIYGSGTEVEESGEAKATVLMCWYDQNPFGYAEDDRYTLRATDSRGVETDSCGGGGFSCASVSVWREEVAVQRGDPYVTVSCERFGQVYEAQVPLRWEETP